MKRVRTLLGLFLILLTASGLPAAEPLPPEAFLKMVGKVSAAQKSFAELSGELQYYRKNSGGVERHPVFFAILMENGQNDAVLKLNDGKETYRIRRNTFLRTHAIEPAVAGEILARSGVKASDLVMGFLDGTLEAEEASETLKTVPCRVFRLRSPEGTPVKVWIASEYFFPLKAEFYREAEVYGQAPQLERSLELTGFKKVGDRYVPTDMVIYASEFRTRIAFRECEVADPDDPRAKSVLHQAPQLKQE